MQCSLALARGNHQHFSQDPRRYVREILNGRGHNRGVLAPGGIIYRVDPDGKNFEAYANGFRNTFDAAFNRDGELFTYDADMEYDFNTPWYRATRINHVTSGAEFGWRNGAGKRPPFYADNLPGILDCLKDIANARGPVQTDDERGDS